MLEMVPPVNAVDNLIVWEWFLFVHCMYILGDIQGKKKKKAKLKKTE